MQQQPEIPQPPHDCPLCPRLVAFREEQRIAHPDWYNNPVHGWGDPKAWLCLVGLAPGLRGANRTGRPFTGDWAGDLLFATFDKLGLSEGKYDARPDDGYRLKGAYISNAVRCVPPQNKPTPREMHTCRPFLDAQLAALPNLKVLIALGRIAHESALRSFGLRLASFPFGHGVRHELPGGLTLFDSYHCSRYNTNTGRLTAEMFESVFESACEAAQIYCAKPS
jgi:uracil-DNA glycosylase family 4